MREIKKWKNSVQVFAVLLIIGNVSSVGGTAPLSHLILHEKEAHFVDATFEGIKWEADSLVLDDLGLEKGEGVLISQVITTKFPFNVIVPSWNCLAPQKTGVRIEIRAGMEDRWTDWFEISQWGREITARGDGVKKSWDGYVDADTLELYQHYNNIQYRVTLISYNGTQTPQLKRLALVYTDKYQLGERDDVQSSEAWGKVLDVPFFSQMVEEPSIAGRICSPTSMTMVLNYFQKELPTSKVADLAYDPLNGIYGNWPYTGAVAGEMGLKSYVTRFPDWRGVEEQIIKGNPVIISIRFGTNQLTNSPISSSSGHIIVVRGFTKDGNVICNDPAAYTKDKGQVIYDREELRKAWSNGVAIITEPEQKRDISPWLLAGGVATIVAAIALIWMLLK